MGWNDFLEDNQYKMDYEEWEALDDEDKLFHMEEVIDDFKELLKVNAEEPEGIIHIEQELPGDPFEAWTKLRIYFSEFDDYHERQVVRVAFRHPPYAVVR